LTYAKNEVLKKLEGYDNNSGFSHCHGSRMDKPGDMNEEY
jgi:hypothetical protein